MRAPCNSVTPRRYLKSLLLSWPFYFTAANSAFIDHSIAEPQINQQTDSLNSKLFVSFTPKALDSLDGDTVTNILIRSGKDAWLSTSDKVFRLEGTSLDPVQVVNRPAPLFPESQFEAVIENSLGEIFLIAFDGLIYQFSPQDNLFVETGSRPEMRTGNREIKSSHIDSEDNIWLGYSDGSISQFNTRLHNFSAIKASGNDSIIAILGKGDVTYFIEESGGVLQLLGPNKIQYLNRRCGTSSSPFSSAIINDDDVILLGTKGDGVWRLKLSGSDCITSRAFVGSPYEINSATVHEFSNAQHADRNLILISTDSGVFIAYNNQILTAFSRENADIGTNEVLSARYINNFSMMLGTYTGVRVLKKTNVEFLSEFQGNRSPSIVATTKADGIGTFVADYKKVYKLSPADSTQSMSEVDLLAHRGAGIMSMAADKKNLWIGFRNGHLLIHNLTTGMQREISTDSDGIRIPPISSIYVDRSNRVFIGTFGGGVYTYENEKIERLTAKGDTKPINVLQITRINHMGIVAFSEEGANIVDVDGEDELKAQHNLSILSTYPIWSIDEDENSTWFATPTRGIHVSKRQSNGLLYPPEQIVPESLLKDLVIYGIRLSGGAAYFSSNRGIFRASPEGLINQVFHGSALNSISFDYGTAGSDENGKILFGGTGGIVRITPSINDIERIPGSLNITQVFINGKVHSLPNSSSKRLYVEVEHPSKVLTFEFSIFDLSSTENHQYRYKLHPFDPTWIDGGNDGSATYTNIPPGDYVFHVQGANSAGVWNREGISMNLRVLPPAWRTWWAYCVYALTAYFLLYIGKKWYDSNVLRVKATEMAREKTRDADAALDAMQEQLEAQDSFVRNVRQRNIATLDTVRELIDHRAEYIPDDLYAEIMRGTGAHVHALALLERSLKYYNDRLFADLNAFSADCLSDFCHEYASRHDVTTINEVTHELVPAEDATMLALIIHELLQNAFLHAFNSEQGSKYLRIILVFRKGTLHNTASQIELKVQDNGSGIPDGVSGELPGLSLVQKIVRHYDGEMETTCLDGSAITIVLRVPASKPT